jgi:hypothetical protein
VRLRGWFCLVLGVAFLVAAGVLGVLLAYGFWPGAILALAALLWLGLSARRSTQRKRATPSCPALIS